MVCTRAFCSRVCNRDALQYVFIYFFFPKRRLNGSPDYALLVFLQLRKTQLLNLKPRWETSLVSKGQFDAYITKSAKTVLELSASLTRTDDDYDIHELPPPNHQETQDEEEQADTTGSDDTATLDEDAVIITDMLSVEDDGVQDDIEDRLDTMDIPLLWLAPVRFSYLLHFLELILRNKQPKYTQDMGVIDCLQFQTFGALDESRPRVLRHSKGSIDFELRELNIMTSRTALLNNVCLNGIAQLLFDKFSLPTDTGASELSGRFALFDTYHLPMARYKATDDNLWRRTQHTEYWNKDVWIIPIHRPLTTHWVLCLVSLRTHEFRLYDSFAQAAAWKREIKEIMLFVTRLVILANRKNHPLYVVTEEGWTAKPVCVESTQTNGFDCGLWVLATIAAVLRGYDATGLIEGDMYRFRQVLLHNILALPFSK